jgi:hypothetical protein
MFQDVVSVFDGFCEGQIQPSRPSEEDAPLFQAGLVLRLAKLEAPAVARRDLQAP